MPIRTTKTARFRMAAQQEARANQRAELNSLGTLPRIVAVEKLNSYFALSPPCWFAQPRLPSFCRIDVFQLRFEDNEEALVFQPFLLNEEQEWVWTGRYPTASLWLMAKAVSQPLTAITDLPEQWMRDKAAELPQDQQEAVLASFGCLQDHPQAFLGQRYADSDLVLTKRFLRLQEVQGVLRTFKQDLTQLVS